MDTKNLTYFNLGTTSNTVNAINTNSSMIKMISGVNIPLISGQDWLKRSVKVLEVTFRDRLFSQWW